MAVLARALKMPTTRRLPPASVMALAMLLLAASGAFALLVGSSPPSGAPSWHALIASDDPAHQLIWALRAPRVALAMTVGALLAIGAGLLQVLLQNPLAEPYVLGLSGGASFGALLTLSVGAASSTVMPSSMVGATVSLLALMTLARRELFRAQPALSDGLLLCGVMLSALWGAMTTVLLAISDDHRMQRMVFWLMGDLSSGAMPLWAVLVLGGTVMAVHGTAPMLNQLMRGEETAASLGVSSAGVRLFSILVAALCAATAVSLAGAIGFVGLVAPQIARSLVGSNQRIALPTAALLGATILVVADTGARTLLAPVQLPTGAITAMIGVPFFLLTRFKRR